MAKTLQKKIKFSKGQITPNLQERTDLEIYDSSASVLENVDVTLYGGVKSRHGTSRITEIQAYNPNSVINYSAITYIGGSVSGLKNNGFISDETGGESIYLRFDLGQIESNARFNVENIRFQHENFVGKLDCVRTSANYPVIDMSAIDASITNEGVGINDSVPLITNIPSNATNIINSLTLTTDNAGSVTNLSGTFSYRFTWTGSKASYNSWDGKQSLILNDNHIANSTVLRIEQSNDGSTWTLADTVTINENYNSFASTINGRYIRIVPQNDVKAKLSIDKVTCLKSGAQTQIGRTRLVDFIFNNNEKYLFVLIKGRIDVYKLNINNIPVFVETINATVLTDSIIPNLKWTYKDDTIVFTHEDMPPYQLVRQADSDWNWSQITLQDIPKELFGNAIITPKTVSLTPDKVEGIVTLTAGSTVFDSGYEGQIIDGNGGRVRVTKYISQTKVSGYTIIPFYNTDSFSSWNYESGYEAVWSATKGYPRCCCIANERLFFAGTPTKPNTIWASRVADYFNFKNAGNYDNDSISFTMDTNAVIYDMIFNRGLHIFTSDFEASSPENSFTPNSFKVIPTTKNGIHPLIRPVVADGQIMYIDATGKKLLSYTYNDNINSYESKNLAKLTDLIETPKSLAIKKDIDGALRIYIEVFKKVNIAGISFENYNGIATMTISTEDELFAPAIYKFGNINNFPDEYRDVCSVGNEIFFLKTFYDIGATQYKVHLEQLEGNIDDAHKVIVRNHKITDVTMASKLARYTYQNKDYDILFDNLGEAEVIPDNATITIGEVITSKIKGNKISINHRTDTKKRIAKATVMCKGKEITFCGQTKKITNNYQPADFYACTLYGKDITYNIEGTESLDILSIELNINYEG